MLHDPGLAASRGNGHEPMSVVSEQDGEHLLKLARDRSVAGRRELIDTVTDLFFSRSEWLTDRERSLMTGILRQLIHDVEIEVRRALAERLAREGRAPRELVVALANDAIEIAYPILVHSTVLRDVELIEIIHHRTLEHQLAIATRKDVSEAVSDALVQCGSVDVVKALLENESAQISQETLAYLVEQSARVDTYQNPLLRRRDLTPALARRMYRWVSATLRQYIVETFDVDPDEIEQSLAATVDELAAAAAAEPPSATAVLARRLADSGELDPSLLVQTLRQGEIGLFEALFSRLSGIRPASVRRLLFEASGERLTIACKALALEPSVFASIFVLTRKARAHDGVLEPGEVALILGFYERIRREAAEKLLRQWRRDPELVRAVWHVERPARSHAGA